jgi:hypothetical protein
MGWSITTHVFALEWKWNVTHAKRTRIFRLPLSIQLLSPCIEPKCRERSGFLAGRLPSRARGGAKSPLAAAWADADARCPVRWRAPESFRGSAEPTSAGLRNPRHRRHVLEVNAFGSFRNSRAPKSLIIGDEISFSALPPLYPCHC